MSEKRVIIASPHVWDSPYRVGSHHYARCFADAGWKVAYLSAPISPLHVVYHALSPQRAKAVLPQRWRSWAAGGLRREGIWTYVPFGLVPVANLFPFNTRWVLDHAGSFLLPPLARKLAHEGFASAQVLWLDSPLYGHLLDRIPHRTSVLRVADDSSGFPGLGRNIIEAEERLARRVDLVVATTASLEAKARAWGAREVMLIPNGVDFEHFTHAHREEPPDLAQIRRPRVMYVGVIEHWFDQELVAQAARELPQASFVIIGPAAEGAASKLAGLPNVHLLGGRPYDSLPSYLRHASAGIIPFKRLRFVESVNPIKLYEYMACGLPVVAVRWKALEEMGSPALLASTKEEFVEGLRNALASGNEGRDGRVEFARNNSWRTRFAPIEKRLHG